MAAKAGVEAKEQIMLGKFKNLVLCMNPAVLHTEIAEQLFPAWP